MAGGAPEEVASFTYRKETLSSAGAMLASVEQLAAFSSSSATRREGREGIGAPVRYLQGCEPKELCGICADGR